MRPPLQRQRHSDGEGGREDVRITSLVPSPLAQLPHVAYSTNSAFVAHIHLHNNAYI